MIQQHTRFVDLTYDLSNDMPIPPGIPRPVFRDVATVERHGYSMSEYQFWNHIGTHLDAPSHHVAGPSLDDIALNRLITQAVVLDFSRHAPGPLTYHDVQPHLEHIFPNDVILIYSGNGRNWGTERYWTGWCYPDEEAAHALLACQISGIGFDGPSADRVNLEAFPLHKIWLGAGCLILENVANLDQVPERFLLIIAPLKVRAANGAPTRLFALCSQATSIERA
jgi:arylformamidase